MRTLCGGLLFTSDFECGNLARVELASRFRSTAEGGQRGHGRSSLKTASLATTDPQKIPAELPIVVFRGEDGKFDVPHFDTPLAKDSKTKTAVVTQDRSTGTKNKGTPRVKTRGDGTDGTDKTGNVDLEFCVWTKPDCYMTPYQNGNRSWYYFGVQGGPPGARIKINIMNLNFQQKLYSQGMAPVYRVVPGKEKWERIPKAPKHRLVDDGNLMLSFCHRLPLNPSYITYFAFTYPYTYTDCQKMLDSLDVRYSAAMPSFEAGKDSEAVYYYRELLCNSLDGKRLDLLTISSYHNISEEREPSLPDLFPELTKKRCHRFYNKKIIFISARVHPGETPSSFVFLGFLNFILSSDERAAALRKHFVFKMVPMLNPDGVVRGHYRTDSKGVNLNRVYLDPTITDHPTIYAVRKLILYYHSDYYKKLAEDEDDDPPQKATDIDPRIENSIAQKTSHVVSSSSSPDSAEGERKRPDYSNLSGIFCYVDFHGHASKPGCFVYGNYFEDMNQKIECILLPKLVSLNCPYFDFNSCNFSKQNMMRRGPDDATNKEGCGRVAVYKMTGIIHSYTLECNYNGSSAVNISPFHSREAAGLNNPALNEAAKGHCRFTPEIFEEVGQALAISILDLTGLNPRSVVAQSTYRDLDGIRSWILCHLQFQKALKACNKLFPKKYDHLKLSGSRVSKDSNNPISKNSDTLVTPSRPTRPSHKVSTNGDLKSQQGGCETLTRTTVRRFPRRGNYCWVDPSSAVEKSNQLQEVDSTSAEKMIKTPVHRASLRVRGKKNRMAKCAQMVGGQCESPHHMLAIRNRRLQSIGNMRPQPKSVVLKTIEGNEGQNPLATRPVPVITVRARETVCDKCESPVNMFCTCTPLTLPFLGKNTKDGSQESISTDKKPGISVVVTSETPPSGEDKKKPGSSKRRTTLKAKSGALLASNSSSSSTNSLSAK